MWDSMDSAQRMAVKAELLAGRRTTRSCSPTITRNMIYKHCGTTKQRMRTYLKNKGLRQHHGQLGLDGERGLVAEYARAASSQATAVTRQQLTYIFGQILRIRQRRGNPSLNRREVIFLEELNDNPNYTLNPSFFGVFEEQNELRSGPISTRNPNREDQYTEEALRNWELTFHNCLRDEGFLVSGTNRIKPNCK